MKTVGIKNYNQLPPNMKLAILSAGYKYGRSLKFYDENKKEIRIVDDIKDYAKDISKNVKDKSKNYDKLLITFYKLHLGDMPRNIIQSILAGDREHYKTIEYKLHSVSLENQGYNFEESTQKKLIELLIEIRKLGKEPGLIELMNEAKEKKITEALNKALDSTLEKYKNQRKDGGKAGEARDKKTSNNSTSQNVNDKKTTNKSSSTKQEKSNEPQQNPKESLINRIIGTIQGKSNETE